MLLLILFGLITAAYLGLIISFLYGWKRMPDFQLKGLSAENTFSIVIPYRNEAGNLPALLRSLSGIKYPTEKFEIILINDASKDNSREICETFLKDFPSFNIRLLENNRQTNSPKKDAIRTAIESSGFDYIATTDADCVIPANWLYFFDEMIRENNSEMIAGPVGFIQRTIKKPYFQNFEEMDFMSLQASTIGAFGIEKAFMCNGANLCYKKALFKEGSGFSGNENLASGDDVFLLQDFRKKGKKVSFIKSEKAAVFTNYQKSLHGLIQQRIRWAAKTSAYTSLFAKFTGFIVFLMNLSLIVFTVLAFMDLFSFQYLMLIFLLKFNADFMLIFKAAKFMNRESLMRHYFWCSIAYPFFSVYVASLSLFKGYEWKGRRFKR
ncbi:cellulose synthase/poly-beta-1,6-N-acetylglucosamine synthase-like glycosyltransferase [Christiangramia gaetbulicola]|uniref:Cellulose synthase/poly-beta-1,6-N-acetylglucosamine synthase-like glycosyltransferase n=1 Tax=Christiangramia gaetbulicola TaxID=703340 RepID=A0A2T6AL89_9FLAO|nr:glycosyltransferase [Christiangramia gaetbulicola]PTX44593.1 cellulose synthase/poly-beta-1,6-N-acetylglucosamine synthase-like glycosyltransferase [Christiangramia gaetbulicola]